VKEVLTIEISFMW